jgi:predicted aldo/keto reductase-like oxidoreductase
MPVRHRQLKGVSVSIIGVGGSALGDVKDDSEAGRIVSEALENGINFFDNAWSITTGWWLPSIQAHLELAVDLTQHIGGASPFKSN